MGWDEKRLSHGTIFPVPSYPTRSSDTYLFLNLASDLDSALIRKSVSDCCSIKTTQANYFFKIHIEYQIRLVTDSIMNNLFFNLKTIKYYRKLNFCMRRLPLSTTYKLLLLSIAIPFGPFNPVEPEPAVPFALPAIV
jgi:hypothetical protein